MKTSIRKKQTILRLISVIAVSIVLVLSAIFEIGGGGKVPAVFALANDNLHFDETYVMDDLAESEINGKPFDIADYSFDESRNTGVLLFTEYCYSFYSNRQGNYGLYVYVWNPQGLNIDVDNVNNKIQFSAGDKSHYGKYWLECLSVCDETNYEGLFYKFKVYLPESNRAAILNRLDSGKRFYHVSGIELVTKGDVNATETTINLEYTFSGYSEGYGSNSSSGDTLVCNTEQGEVLTLDVHSTYYRPAGASGGDINTQDTLHSVYFSVPNALIKEYGKMTAVHATWLNALTKMIYVTGNRTVYNALSPFIGVELGSYERSGVTYYADDDMRYAFIADFWTDGLVGHLSTHSYRGDYFYNWGAFGSILSSGYAQSQMKQLDYLFYAENGNADEYTLSAEKILAYLKSYTSAHGGALINDKYSAALFENVDDEFTDVNIRADKTFSLTSETIDRSWWDRLWGNDGDVTDSVTYDGIEAIKEVTANDFTDDETANCDNLFIGYADYDEFKAYYDTATTANETVYLFRYYVSEYYAAECTEFEMPARDVGSTAYGSADELDTNAYLCQMWVQLDFDIIDVTFTNGGVDTVIPVVSSPMDVVADATPPIETTDDIEWWKIVLAVLLLILLFIILATFLPWIFEAVIWVVSLPFKALGALFKGIGNAANKRKRGK